MTARDFLAELERLPDAALVPVGWVREQLAGPGNGAGQDKPEELLTAEEAAERLGVTPDWLYRRAKSLPFVRKLSRKVTRYSAAGIAAYLAARKGA